VSVAVHRLCILWYGLCLCIRQDAETLPLAIQ